MADTKKPWSTPSVTRLNLSESELASLFPQLGEQDRRRLSEKRRGGSAPSEGS